MYDQVEDVAHNIVPADVQIVDLGIGDDDDAPTSIVPDFIDDDDDCRINIAGRILI